MGERVFIAIGSNLGDRAGNCLRAVEEIARGGEVRVVGRSRLYRTAPWGVEDQPEFVNCVIEVATQLEPAALLRLLKSVEAAMGRAGRVRWGPREIDLDIIFYGGRVVDEPGLKIPHPHAHERAFVLVPLADIAGDFMHPELGRTVDELVGGLGGKALADVERIDE